MNFEERVTCASNSHVQFVLPQVASKRAPSKKIFLLLQNSYANNDIIISTLEKYSQFEIYELDSFHLGST